MVCVIFKLISCYNMYCHYRGGIFILPKCCEDQSFDTLDRVRHIYLKIRYRINMTEQHTWGRVNQHYNAKEN